MIDVASRMPLAWVIAENPKAEATLALFRMATRDKTREKRMYGCTGEPAAAVGLMHVKNDNGPGLRNTTAVGALVGLGSINTVTRTFASTDRSVIERLFGTVEMNVLSLLPGYTGGRPGELPGSDAVANGVLTIEQLHEIVTRYFINEYHSTRHHGVGMGGRRPAEAHKSISENRRQIPQVDPQERRIHLGWEEEVTPTDEGVRVFKGIWFNSDEFQQERERCKGKVKVFIDPDDINFATVVLPTVKDPIEVKLQNTAFADMTLPEGLRLMAVQRKEDPSATEFHEDQLMRTRLERHKRIRAIGVEHNLPRSYSTLAECKAMAKSVFAGALVSRTRPSAGTTRPGEITIFNRPTEYTGLAVRKTSRAGQRSKSFPRPRWMIRLEAISKELRSRTRKVRLLRRAKEKTTKSSSCQFYGAAAASQEPERSKIMMFINNRIVEASAPLNAAHFDFPRGVELRDAMSWCVTDYYTKASIGKPFEARGLLVTGASRQGKSREIQHLRDEFNEGAVIMPDGRPAKIINCTLSGKVTWKDLGVEILNLLGYDVKGRHTQAHIWNMVVKNAQLQGVIGIHFDECQHVFTDEGERTNQQIRDSFKTLLKAPRWPLMLILSGIPSLANHNAKEEKLARLLRTVRFDEINIARQADMDELLQLTFSFADQAGLDFAPLASTDFLERLAFACCDRWGLVIEMLIEVFTHCRISDEKICTIDHFSRAYATIYSAPIGYSPFTMPNYRDNFDHGKLSEILQRTQSSFGNPDRTRPASCGPFRLPVPCRGAQGYGPGARTFGGQSVSGVGLSI